MKILLIAFSFPPINNAQSIRWKYLGENLLKMGIKLDVISPKLNFEPCNKLSVDKKINVKRVYPGITLSFLLKKKGKIKRKFTFHLSRFMLSFYEFLMLGEAYIEWSFHLSKFIRKEVDIESYDFLIFSAEPHIATIIPILFLNHPRVILDIGDPPIANYYLGFKAFQKLHESVFNLICRKIRGVVYTSWNSKLFLEKIINNLSQKPFRVIHQGFVDIDINKDQEIKVSRLKIFYPGSFLENIRNPELLVRVLSRYENIEFFYAGPENPVFLNLFKDKLGNRFTYLGNLSHDRILKILKEFEVLLYLGNKNVEQLSGKFFEFLGTNSIILQIYQNFKDETLKLTNNITGFISCYYDEFCLNLAIMRLINYSNFMNRQSLWVRRKYFENFNWNNLARKYLEFLTNFI